MLNALLNQTLKNSIAQRWFIVAAAIAVTFWGVFSVTQMPLDVFPPFAPPQVDIQVEAVGLAPEEMETQINLLASDHRKMAHSSTLGPFFTPRIFS